jgi:hypothetical protein
MPQPRYLVRLAQALAALVKKSVWVQAQ